MRSPAGRSAAGPLPGADIVGSHDDVADRLVEPHRARLDEFIFSGHPHLEEALRFGEEVTPRVRWKLTAAH